jgi:orotidine-5'-phosphate decarboxylase
MKTKREAFMSRLSPIIVALDLGTYKEAKSFAKKLDPDKCQVKVGLELFIADGKKILSYLHKNGFKVFLDLKLKDIPVTASKAALSIVNKGVWMTNMHADGSSEMMKAVVKACGKCDTIFLGVTVLTSMDQYSLEEVGITSTPIQQVERLAVLSDYSFLDGVVCSGQEVKVIKSVTRNDFITVTPGIRDPENGNQDQKRVVTIEDALNSGADYVVIGRPISGADDPALALENFYNRANKVFGV